MSNNPRISIIVPGIRPEKWWKMYQSIYESTHRSFELIIASPFPLPEEFSNRTNVILVKTFASPVVASQMCVSLCRGDLITYGADDAIFLKDALDAMVDTLEAMPVNPYHRNVVIAKYYEGNELDKPLQPYSYFKLSGSTSTNTSYIHPDWWIFNIAIMEKVYFEEMGGWDCEFEATAMSHADTAVRFQLDGAVVKMSPLPLFDCEHEPGTSGTHFAVHHAQLGNDEPRFRRKYSQPLEEIQTRIALNNWKNAPSIWDRRF